MTKSPSVGISPSSDHKYLRGNGAANGGIENGHHSPASPVEKQNGHNGEVATPLKGKNSPAAKETSPPVLPKVGHIDGIASEPVHLNMSPPKKKYSLKSKDTMKLPKHGKNEPLTLYEKVTSVEVEPGVRASNLCKPNEPLISTPLGNPNCKTTWDAFQRGLRVSRNNNCLGWRSGNTYEWWTYDEVAERVRQVCSGLKNKTSLTRQNFVGIYAGCIPQWIICAIAINARSLCIIPLYDTLGSESCVYIINQVEMRVLLADTPAAVSRILEGIDSTPTLKTIVCFQQDLSPELVEKAKAASVELMTLATFVAEPNGKDMSVYDEPETEDIAMIQYTSGTTGFPKGVVQTHRAYISNFTGVDYPLSLGLDPAMTMSSKDICLQYLPLAHAYAQICCTWFLYSGCPIGFFGGNAQKLVEDAAILKPTFIPMVPRLMNRIYGKVKGELENSGIKSRIFNYCYEKKKEMMNKGIITKSSVWDTIAFRKVQRLLGGNVRLMTVGSAPVSAEVLEFWRVVFGCMIVEGYGQTECTAVATFAIGPKGGNVGHPLVCNNIKLVDVPDCGYYVKDGKGEVCIKGPNVMNGYYKQPEKTAETIDEDGWLHTGDIGEFLEDGALRIVDRKKHIFKLAQGEYIAPEKIENVYAMCPAVAQVFIDGSSLEAFTVAVVVPDPDVVQNWIKNNQANADGVMTNPEFLKFILNEINTVGKANKLNSLEMVKNVYCTADMFTPSNGLLTPSLKNKRPELRRYFKDQIEAMYKAGPLNVSSANGQVNGHANGKANGN